MMLRAGVYLQDRYEILEQIGSGGMSEVYKAKCHTLNRLVAIKVLKEDFCEDESFVERFRMEAQSAAGLMHPNIVNVYDVIDEGDLHYIVMELVEGITLKSYIAKRGHLEIKETVGIAIQVAQGIAAAHEQHIIHRDIKPQNMLIALDGKVKVADFGIARPIAQQTIESAAMGSVHYISPEQARGGFSDERSDIYSLGITMYEMVTGRLPFDGTSTVSIALAHIENAMVPPSVYNPDIPSNLERIILKCCEKKPERRYQNVNALIADLREVLLMPDDELCSGGGTAAEGTIVLMDGGTRKISDEELAIIQQATKELESEEEEKEDKAEKATGRSAAAGETPFIETSGSAPVRPSTRGGTGAAAGGGGRQNGGRGDYYSDDQGGEEGPRFERIFTVAGIVAAIIIVVILIAVFLKLGGVFRAGTGLFSSGTAVSEAGEDSDSKEPLADTEVYVPDVTGLTQDSAADKLTENSLSVKYTYEDSDLVEQGRVIRQEPEAGSVASRWSDVTLIVSSGSDKIDLTTLGIDGQTVDEATSILRSIGLEVITMEVSDDSAAAGTVVAYAPEQAAAGSTVTLSVSSGPAFTEVVIVAVPDIVGLTEEDAIAVLAEAGLAPGITELVSSDTVEQGRIVSQSQGEGGVVDYAVSSGPSEEVVETVSTQRYVASINDVYELKNLIGPGAGTASMTISIRLHQNTNGTDIYQELTGAKTITGDVVVPISYTSIESLNGSDVGEVEVVNADTGEVLASYPLTFFPMD